MLTEKEKTLLKLFIRKRSKEQVQKDMDEFVRSDGQKTPKQLEMLMVAMNYEKFTSLAIQYLNYANNYYNEIVSGDFSNDIERVGSFDIIIGAEETELVFVEYKATVVTLPSLVDVIAKDFMDNKWDYDPERDIIDYGETLSVVWDDEYSVSEKYRSFRPTTPTTIE
jgi:hypothetical protein